MSEQVVYVDWDRAFMVLDRLMVAYESFAYPYNKKEVQVPQRAENLPKNFNSPLDHARFFPVLDLWMKGPIKTETAFQLLAKVHEEFPEVFIPSEARKLEPEMLDAILRSFGLNQLKWNVPGLIVNAAILDDYWDGDPRNFYRDLPEDDYEKAVVLAERITNVAGKNPPGLWGHQLKMRDMHTFYQVDSALVYHFFFSSPADFHNLRVLTATEALCQISSGQVNLAVDAVFDVVRDVTMRYAIERSVSPLSLSNAIWMFSGYMCGRTPGNQSVTVGGNRMRATQLAPMPITWTEAQVSSYGRSCGSCVLADLCTHYMRSAPHYRLGVAFLEPRLGCPYPIQPRLFDAIEFDPVQREQHRKLWTPKRD